MGRRACAERKESTFGKGREKVAKMLSASYAFWCRFRPWGLHWMPRTTVFTVHFFRIDFFMFFSWFLHRFWMTFFDDFPMFFA